MELTKYDIVVGAYKSRLAFRTEGEYRKALGVTFETLAKKGTDSEIEGFYNLLNRELQRLMPDKSLEEVMEEYALASDLYLSLPWGDRSQGASRKRFCRMLFRLVATGGIPLSAEEIEKFRNKEADSQLLSLLFPDGTDREPAVNILYILLFAFNIIKPWGYAPTEGTRSRQSKDITDRQTLTSLSNLRDLLTTLRDDIPWIGSTAKPLVFAEWLANVDQYLSDPENLSGATPLWMIASLVDAIQACRSILSPVNMRETEAKHFYPNMTGIWIDDAEGNADRFWIFPENMRLSFCYEWNGTNWVLTPYSFTCRLNEVDDGQFPFLFLPTKLFIKPILDPTVSVEDSSIANGLCEFYFHDGDACRVEFTDELLPFPDWFRWRAFDRLDRDDPRHGKFLDILKGVYDANDARSSIFENEAPITTDSPNCFIGRDREYLYISDLRFPDRCKIQQTEEDGFIYKEVYRECVPELSLFSLEISEDHPLYAMPLNLRKRSRRRDCWWRLQQILEYVEQVDEVYIYHREGKAPVLYFPIDYVTIPLEPEELKEHGVRIYRSREDIINNT